MTNTEVREVVRKKYGEAARRATAGDRSGCCGSSEASCGADPITSDLYDALQTREVPEKAVLASLGCGNPSAGPGLLQSLQSSSSPGFRPPSSTFTTRRT